MTALLVMQSETNPDAPAEGVAITILTGTQMLWAGIGGLVGLIVLSALFYKWSGRAQSGANDQLRGGLLFGLCSIAIVYAALVLSLGTISNTTGVVAVVGVVTGILGTFLGAYFGVEVAGQAAAEANKNTRETNATTQKAIDTLNTQVQAFVNMQSN